MTDTTNTLATVWRHAVNDLLRLAGDPESGIPPLTPSERAFINLVKPAAQVPGFIVLSTTNEVAKKIIETTLAEPLSKILSERLGERCALAVSIDRTTSTQQESTPSKDHQVTQLHPVHSVTELKQSEEKIDDSALPTPEPSFTTDDGLFTINADSPSESSPKETPSPATNAHTAVEVEPSQKKLPKTETARWIATVARESRGAVPGVDTTPPPEDSSTTERNKSLNPRYTFDRFVTGSSNRFAHAAAFAVAESPAQAFNPLFIWGGSGLGKTHLLHATGNYAQQLHPNLRIRYVSSEQFTNDYINSVRDHRPDSFKRRYRSLDILMVDDIQFLVGKEGTQEEFFHTFNALHQANKQIILSSDRPPKHLTTLEDRLRTRFEGGLITDIQPPDLETRIAILSKKAQMDGTDIGRDVLSLIASRFESSIRELEGALIRVAAYSSLIKQPINVDMAEKALRDILPDSQDVTITAAQIIDVSAEYFSLSLDMLTGASRTRNVVHARQLAMYLCRELTDLSLPKIADFFGGRDHTTVMYADRKIRGEINENRETYDQIQELTQLIKTRGRAR